MLINELVKCLFLSKKLLREALKDYFANNAEISTSILAFYNETSPWTSGLQ